MISRQRRYKNARLIVKARQFWGWTPRRRVSTSRVRNSSCSKSGTKTDNTSSTHEKSASNHSKKSYSRTVSSRFFTTLSSITSSSRNGLEFRWKKCTTRFLPRELSIAVSKTTDTLFPGVSKDISVTLSIKRRGTNSSDSRVNLLPSIKLRMGRTMWFICLTYGRNNWSRFIRLNYSKSHVLKMP